MKHNNVFYFLSNKRGTHKTKTNNKTTNKPLIHKIATIDFFIKNELTNILKIYEIPAYKNYYYACINSTELKIANLYDTRQSKTDNTLLMQFEDRNLIYLKSYLKDLSSSTKYILTIIDLYKYMLHSINMLVGKRLVHNNINFDALVVDASHSQILLSGFSFSIDITQPNIEQYFKHFFIEYDPSYLEWTLEFHIVSYLLTNKLSSLSSYNIEHIIHEVSKQHTILHTFGDAFVSLYKEEALIYFKKYVNRSYEYILTDILSYYNTWDNYALSILLLRILIGIHKTIGIKNKFIILFMKLLVSNIHFNPLKRGSIEVTTNKFNELLDSLSPKDYKEVIRNLHVGN
jgi:hypothetical protein